MSLKQDRERLIGALKEELSDLDAERVRIISEIDRLDAWLSGWAAHEALLVEPPMLPAEPPRLKNVKKNVMEFMRECIDRSNQWCSIAAIAEMTDLPQESVYHCVMREVRRGTVERSDHEITPLFRLAQFENRIMQNMHRALGLVEDGDASGLV